MRRAHRRVLIGLSLVTAILAGATASLAQQPGGSPVELRLDRARVEGARLDPVVLGARARSFRAVGADPAAPRHLVLWRNEGERFRRVATTRSNAQGRFDFGEQALNLAASRFHVAPAGDVPEASPGAWIEGTLPAPLVVASGLEPSEIEVAPGLADGVLEVRDAESGRLLLRRVVDSDPRRRARIDFVAEGLVGRTRRIRLEQVLPDGRRSPPTEWTLPNADPFAGLD